MPHLRPLYSRQPRLAGVLDHGELVLLGDRVDRVHLARHAEDVDRHDGAGAIGDPAFDRRRVHGERGRVGVGEHRQGFGVEDRVVGGDERVGGDDHLVAGVHVHDVQADHQRGGAAGRGQAAFGAEQLRIGLLEVGHVLVPEPRIPSSAPQHLEDGGLPRLAPLRASRASRPCARACRRARPVWRRRRSSPRALAERPTKPEPWTPPPCCE